MTKPETIQETTASGSDIVPIIERIEDSLGEDTPTIHIIMALLTMVLIVMKPGITPEGIQTGIKDLSLFICNMPFETMPDLGENPTVN